MNSMHNKTVKFISRLPRMQFEVIHCRFFSLPYWCIVVF